MARTAGVGAATVPRDADTDARRWARVVARDSRAAGVFVYGVASTGIFCRPGCPSRRPRREGVRFFDSGRDALRAGFRPCLRCRPLQEAHQSRPATAVRRAAAWLAGHADQPAPLKLLAEVAGMSPFHLQRSFQRALGVSPRQFQAACRALRFRSELSRGRDVASALYHAGYGSPSRLYHARPTGPGLRPAAYRSGGAGRRISYTVVPCALGRALVAATAQGICSVKIGDRDTVLEDELRREFPSAELVRGGRVQSGWVREIVSRLRGSAEETTLPLDIRGTAFQWRVWRELQRIPHGCTRSYSEVARAIGRPSAPRAVARACASNPVAIAIPCHRVVRRGGDPGGYRWGVDRKQRLLEKERGRAQR